MEQKHCKELDLERLKLPKYSAEQRVVQKALSILSGIGNPRFSVSDNCWKSDLKAKDDARLWYARGLLESLLFEEKGEDNGKRTESDTK